MTAQRIDPRQLPSEVRRVNRGLMAQFIGADPYGRRHLSPRKSIVLDNGEGLFRYALNEKPNRPTFLKLYQQTPVRYWSRGSESTAAPRYHRRALGLRAEGVVRLCGCGLAQVRLSQHRSQ